MYAGAAVLLGPLSSASPDGVGPVFASLFIVLAIAVAIHVWRFYLSQAKEQRRNLLRNVLWISAIAMAFLFVGIRDLLRGI